MRDLKQALGERRRQSLYRSHRINQGPQQVETQVDGRQCLAFCSNDYLGLANHPEVIAAAKQGLDRFGVGAGAAHLINGHSVAHQALEEELAGFVGYPRTLLFSSGYLANQGVISTLLKRGDRVFQDRLNHASLLDGAQLSGARLLRYNHCDMDHLEMRLQMPGNGERLLVSDGVFSMDGDIAPLPAMAELAQRYDAWLMVDDAHGLGVLGETGGGSLDYHGMDSDQVQVLVGTLGKAFGTFGAFVAGSDDLIETLIQQARGYIFTTASPPAIAEATRASLRLIKTDGWRRQKLSHLIALFREGAQALGLPLLDSQTPIQGVVVGRPSMAQGLSEGLWRRGILVSAIRPPTVPEGGSRLRITFSAQHEEHHVKRLLDTLAQLWPGIEALDSGAC